MAFDFVAGCIGGCAGIIVGHPLDTVKVRLQTQDFRTPIYKGAWNCFKTVLKTESVKGLYKGVTSPLSGGALINAIVFGAYGNILRQFESVGLSTHFIAGTAAGVMQAVVNSPLEVAKIKLQVDKHKQFNGTLDCLTKIWRKEGVRGVYRGFSITTVRDAPAYGVYFCAYEFLAGKEDASTFRMLVSGGISGMISWMAIYPIDVIKTRFQSDGLNGPRKYRNAIHCLKLSIQNEGYSLLSCGLLSTCLRSLPVNAVTFAVYTWLMKFASSSSPNALMSSQNQPI